MKSQNRKKVLFLITKSNWGGAQRYVFDLATSLPKEQFEVLVALGGNVPNGTFPPVLSKAKEQPLSSRSRQVVGGGDDILIEKLVAAGIRVIHIPGLQRDISLSKELTSFRNIQRIIKSEQPDVLHVNSSKAGGIGALAGRLNGTKRIIYTAHGWAFNEDRGFVSTFIVGFLHWVTVLLSHKTITVSNGMQQQMRWPFTRNKMVVVHHGRNIGIFEDAETSRAELSKYCPTLSQYSDDFWIGTIAELHPIKRLNIAIESISQLVKCFPNVRFVIIHDGELREQLEKQVASLNLESHIFFTGVVVEAARYLKAFDTFLLSSKSESFGYVLIEAGLAGVPIVATSVGGVTDIITNRENGLLVPPEDSESITSALTEMIENTGLRNKLCNTHTAISNTFTIEKMVTETIAVYNS